jgi:hypothetical protein
MLRSGSKCTFIHGETFAEPDANQDPDHDSEARLAVFRQLAVLPGLDEFGETVSFTFLRGRPPFGRTKKPFFDAYKS